MYSQLIPHGSFMESWIPFGFRVACVWMLFLMSHALPMGSSGCHSDFLRMPYGFLWVPVGFACMHILMYACELIWMRYGLPLDSLWTPPWVPIDPMLRDPLGIPVGFSVESVTLSYGSPMAAALIPC